MYLSHQFLAMVWTFHGLPLRHGYVLSSRRGFGQWWLDAIVLIMMGARRNWSDFWTEYKKVNPGFELFSMPNVDLSRTAAWLVHGDEGRTLKKNGIMITSLQSALGRGYDEKRVAGPPGKLRVNFAGHSFTTRYIVSATPKTVYESTPEVFHSSIEHVAKSLSKCLHEGICGCCNWWNIQGGSLGCPKGMLLTLQR